MDTLGPKVLDLKKFGWVRDHKNYTVLAITTFRDEDVVVFRAQEGGVVDILTVDEFCRTFDATYQLVF